MSLIQLNLPNPPTGKLAYIPGQSFNLGSLSMMQSALSNSGQFVSPERAMRSAAVLACIRIICEDLSAMPLNLYRRTSTGAELATDHPLFHLLHNAPNNWQTSTEVREAMILDVLCFGQSFIEKEFNRDGISALYPLSAGRMVFVNPLDMFIPPPVPLFFRYADPRVGQRILMSDDLWITRMLGPAGTVEGQSLILLAREAIGLALAADEQAGRLFSHGIQSDMTLSVDGEMDKDAKDQLRDAFMRRHSGSGQAWMPLLLEGGLKANRIGLTAQE